MEIFSLKSVLKPLKTYFKFGLKLNDACHVTVIILSAVFVSAFICLHWSIVQLIFT